MLTQVLIIALISTLCVCAPVYNAIDHTVVTYLETTNSLAASGKRVTVSQNRKKPYSVQVWDVTDNGLSAPVYLEEPSQYTSSTFGECVDISGDYIAVGSSSPRYACLYHYNSDTQVWDQDFHIDPMTSAKYGDSIAVSNVYMAVGANQYNGGGLPSKAGTFHLIRLSDHADFGYFSPPTLNSYDYFGWKLAAYSSTVVAATNPNNEASRRVFICDIDTDGNPTWTELARPDVDDGRFGTSIDIYADYVVVGSTSYSFSGKVHVYQRDSATGLWPTDPTATLYGYNQADLYGSSVSMGPEGLLVGASAAEVICADGSISASGRVEYLDLNWLPVRFMEYGDCSEGMLGSMTALADGALIPADSFLDNVYAVYSSPSAPASIAVTSDSAVLSTLEVEEHSIEFTIKDSNGNDLSDRYYFETVTCGDHHTTITYSQGTGPVVYKATWYAAMDAGSYIIEVSGIDLSSAGPLTLEIDFTDTFDVTVTGGVSWWIIVLIVIAAVGIVLGLYILLKPSSHHSTHKPLIEEDLGVLDKQDYAELS